MDLFYLFIFFRSHSSWPPKNHLDSSVSARTSTTAVLPDEKKIEQHERLYASKPEQMNTNRLINEKSPYLLQHAHNPVDWYPWGGAFYIELIKFLLTETFLVY